MVESILRHTNPAKTVNYSGGETHTISKWDQLMRFLIMGTTGGTYYISEREHTLNNVEIIDECLAEDPIKTISKIVAVSQAGRAPKNDFAIYALAKACSAESLVTRKAAYPMIPYVCRTGTHILQFVAAVDSMRGWGTALRREIANWYTQKSSEQLAYQVLKYPNRSKWTHRDVLRKTHPKVKDARHNEVLRYIVGGLEKTDPANLPDIIIGREIAHQYPVANIVIDKIKNNGLTREMVPTELLGDATVLRALAEDMPYTAFMRNLGNMTRLGLFDEVSFLEEKKAFLTNPKIIQNARVHPINILIALRTYTNGTGFRGTHSWTPNTQIANALEEAFYLAFENVEPTGKRFLLGLDVSGSMSIRLDGSGVLSAAEVSAAIMMMLLRTEHNVLPMAFAKSFIPLHISPLDSLNTVLDKMSMPFGFTDCSVPMAYALQENISVDTFIVITDNETFAHRTEPSEMLLEYRKHINPDAKLLVLATEATPFSIADPNDAGMLDIAGFDSSVPAIMREFVLGNI